MKNKLIIGLLLIAQVHGMMASVWGTYNPRDVAVPYVSHEEKFGKTEYRGHGPVVITPDVEKMREAQLKAENAAYDKSFATQMDINNERGAKAQQALLKDQKNRNLQMQLAIAKERQGQYLEAIQDMPMR